VKLSKRRPFKKRKWGGKRGLSDTTTAAVGPRSERTKSKAEMGRDKQATGFTGRKRHVTRGQLVGNSGETTQKIAGIKKAGRGTAGGEAQ